MRIIAVFFLSLFILIVSCEKNDQVISDDNLLSCNNETYPVDSHVQKVFDRLGEIESVLRQSKWEELSDFLDKLKKDLHYFEDEINKSGGSLRMDISLRIISIMKGELSKKSYYETRTRFEYLQASILRTFDFLETDLPLTFNMLFCQLAELDEAITNSLNWQLAAEEYDEVLKFWVIINSAYLENPKDNKSKIIKEDVKLFIDGLNKLGMSIQNKDLDEYRVLYKSIQKTLSVIVRGYVEKDIEEDVDING